MPLVTDAVKKTCNLALKYPALSVFLLAFAARIAFLCQAADIPTFYQLMIDSHDYDLWAQNIAGGQWIGKEVFHQAPLYPYFLGVIYFIFGRDLWILRVIQALIGAGACSLLFMAGRAFISEKAGLIAGLLLALNPSAIFFDGLVQKSVLDTFFTALMLFLVGSAQKTQKTALWVAMGAALGLFALTRENMLLLLGILPPWIFWYFRDRPLALRAKFAALFMAGFFAVVLPVSARNLVVGGQFSLTSSQLGQNFFIGNNEKADGRYMALMRHGVEWKDALELAERMTGRKLSPREVSGFWMKKSLEWVNKHPGDWLRLTFKKWMLTWNAYELPDTDDMYIYAEYSPLLRFLDSFNHMGTLCPLAAAGIMLLWARRRDLAVLYAYILGAAASVAIFFVFSRYRFPMVPGLMIIAAGALCELPALLRSGQVNRIFQTAAIIAASAVAVNWPYYSKGVPESASYRNVAYAYARQGRYEDAARLYEKAVLLKPDVPQTEYSLGETLLVLGRNEEAEGHFRNALKLAPAYPQARNGLRQALRRQGKPAETN